jgi:hypothetical protein
MAKHRQEPPHYDPPRVHDTPPKHLDEVMDDAQE